MRERPPTVRFIEVRGAREHNLQGLDLDLELGTFIVVTGPSGSGKSSLAFDTLHAEGNRRYVESLSTHARQFLEQLPRPAVDYIEGLPPTIAIGGGGPRPSPRSTVATATDLHDHFRLLYARVGEPRCPECGGPVVEHHPEMVVDELLQLPPGTRYLLMAPMVVPPAGAGVLWDDLKAQGFVRVWAKQDLLRLEAPPPALAVGEACDVVVDRLVAQPEGGSDLRPRVTESVELAFRTGEGQMRAALLTGGQPEFRSYSEVLRCEPCQRGLPPLTPSLFSFNSLRGACPECQGVGEVEAATCPACDGVRLRPTARAVEVAGLGRIGEVQRLTLTAARERFDRLTLKRPLADPILRGIRSRLRFLEEVGVSYLTLERPVNTLSGGEQQRIRLATQLGSRLSGVCYVLDEPTIGLHPRDTKQLIATLKQLQQLGNTLAVVEHDPQVMRAADQLLELGPGAGQQGGRLLYQGSPAGLVGQETPTGRALTHATLLAQPRRQLQKGAALVVEGACCHNLKEIDVRIPLGGLVAVTGVSGSGKSTLVKEVLHKALAAHLHRAGAQPGAHRSLKGMHYLEKVICMDQRPLSRSLRSNPATYTGVFDEVRQLFAQLKEARMRGWSQGRFSFNSKGGRCEACKGRGVQRVEMQFLPDAYTGCEVCNGRRFNRETLRVRYRGLSIAEVLNLTVEEALTVFRNIPKLKRILETLQQVGLGYLQLGRPSNTLSGGEAQRVKLARELGRTATGHTLYLLDEPTSGLHPVDVERLLKVLEALVEGGNTVLVVEHDLQVIARADWIVDLGPEGGQAGGHVVYEGPPAGVVDCPHSHTGAALRARQPSPDGALDNPTGST